MTTAVRKSSRIQSKESSLKYNEVNSDLDESDQSAEDLSDEEYVTSNNKRVKKSQNSKNTRNKRTKSSNHRHKSSNDSSDDFEENPLYKALSKPEISTFEIALEWVESFIEDEEESKNEAFTNLFNLLLRCCGCVSLVQLHDLVNLDSAAETISELTIMFEKQRVHEYPFISNNKILKFFKSNVLEFFENVIEVSHEKGILYKDVAEATAEDEEESLSSSLMAQILTWFSALSSCTIRPFRYISTVVILAIQSKLCDLLVKITSALEKQQRQLTNARTNSKSKKNKTAHQRKLETITKGIQIYHNQRETILEYFTDIVETIFIHRYRDVDPLIRSECLRSLGYCMMTYPDHFFQSSFLRYFGWLLSDPSEHVRAEVTRVLLKLYKNSNQNGQNMGIGFRQFTERFKKQLINMSWKDKDFNVRYHLVAVLCELLRAGFLDDPDIQEIVSSIFYVIEYGSGSGVANETKLKTELCRFVSLANSEDVKSQLEKFTIFMENYESPQFGDEPGKLTLKDCLQVQSLIKLLRNAYEINTERKSSRMDHPTSPLTKPESSMCSLFKVLYSIPSHSGSWEFLIRYFLYDLSSISFVRKEEKTAEENIEISELKSLLELNSEEDRLCLLKFFHGAISSIFDKKLAKKSNSDESENDPHNVLTKLGNYLPPLSKASSQSADQFLEFLQIWNVLINTSNHSDNIFTVFANLGQENIYNEIIDRIISFYRDSELADLESPIFQAYDEFFERLLSDYDDVSVVASVLDQENNTTAHHSTVDVSSISILNGPIRLQVQNLLQDLAAETRNALSSTDAADSVVIDEITDDDLEDQKIVCNTLIEASKPLSKLVRIGNFINTNEYIADGGVSTSIIDLISIRILSKMDVKPLYSSWPNNFLRIIGTFIQAFRSVLDTLIISTCWKIDILIHSSSGEMHNSQSNYDIESMFDDIATALSQVHNLLSSFDSAVREINENPASCGQAPPKSVTKLIKRFGEVKTLFGAKLIDILVSLRVFYIKFKPNNSFRKFEEFFQDQEGAGKYLSNLIPSDLQHLLLNIFLQKEAKLASFIGVRLDRTDAEDVNFEDLIYEDEVVEVDPQEKSGFGFDDEEVSDEEDGPDSKIDESERQERLKEVRIKQQKSRNIWEAEKDLCVYTVKLFSLVNTGMVNDFVVNRLKLNGSKIGGLYNNILQQNELSAKASIPLRVPDDSQPPVDSGLESSQADPVQTTEKEKTPPTNPSHSSQDQIEVDESM